MSLVAFRRDTEDPDVVKEFADFVGTEDRLKMLCLITLADVGAVSPDTLTPWKEELLWRLYVDTYNHLTQRYGDERIGRNQAGLDRLTAQLPADVTKPELERFVEGLPQRYLQPFAPAAIYQHVRLARNIRPDEVHVSLERVDGAVWSLAVVTLDKPKLFSNICGVLSSFGMNILRGNALTNPNGLVLDVFHFTDDEQLSRDEPRRAGRGSPQCSPTSSPAAWTWRRGCAAASAACCTRSRRSAFRRWSGPATRRRAAIRFSTSSRRTSWACCTGSAASSPSTAVTSTSC